MRQINDNANCDYLPSANRGLNNIAGLSLSFWLFEAWWFVLSGWTSGAYFRNSRGAMPKLQPNARLQLDRLLKPRSHAISCTSRFGKRTSSLAAMSSLCLRIPQEVDHNVSALMHGASDLVTLRDVIGRAGVLTKSGQPRSRSVRQPV